ncbi:MAG: isoleucine--tRNA ligase [Bacillota bacterium]
MFKRVGRPDWPALEGEVLDFWRSAGVFRRSLDGRRGRPAFVFYEGPPTANGQPHVGHVLPRSMKDLITRYKAMDGFFVDRKAGWDTHGLPVELEVEKRLGLSGKADIEGYGVEAFTKKCKESVFQYEQEWERLTERIGYWVDLDDAYVTYRNGYVESVWWALRQIWDLGLLYHGHKVVPYCPRCGTALSDHEVAQGYAEVEDPSVFVRFPVEGQVAGQRDVALLVWTTTPWTLPSNVAIAVRPGETYVVVESAGPGPGQSEKLVVAKGRLEAVFGPDGQAGADDAAPDATRPFRVLAELDGERLLGLRYRPPFDFFAAAAPARGRAFVVVGADFVTLEDGTGLVHLAPAFGEDDMRVGQAEGLAVLQPVDTRGRFTAEVAPWAGRSVKDADPEIVADLARRGLLFREMKYRHPYPFCWRCDTPLLYYARGAWFIRMTAVRDRLLAENATVDWHPGHIGDGRFGDWLENVVDWNLSRERYWGTPLPVWVCPGCGHQHCVGGFEELRRMAVSAVPEGEAFDPHRPYIDEVRLRCPECGGPMRRVPEVIDCWFDSGSMPFAQWHYPFENLATFDQHFPADYVCEAVDQTRGWFYSLLAISTLLFKRAPYRHVLVTGHGLDETGQAMSKHKGNVLNPWAVLDRYGADALRWFLYVTSPPWNAKRFTPEGIAEAQRATLDTLWNVYSFFVLYAGLDGWRPEAAGESGAGDPPGGRPPRVAAPLDRWILSRLEGTVEEVRDALDAYAVMPAARAIADLVSDLSNWYIRRSRRRFWKPGSDRDKGDAYATLYFVLMESVRLLAPFTPFLAEQIYRNLAGAAAESAGAFAPVSVHLCDYPRSGLGLRDRGLEARMETLRRLIALGRAARQRAGVKVRQPLQEMVVGGLSPEMWDGLSPLVDLLTDELNLKDCRPAGDPTEMAGERPGYVVENGGGLSVVLRTEVSDDLFLEGLARELVNRIQRMRKEAGLDVSDLVEAAYHADGKVARAAERYADYIKGETMMVRMEPGQPGEGYASQEWTVEGERFVLWLRRCSQAAGG